MDHQLNDSSKILTVLTVLFLSISVTTIAQSNKLPQPDFSEMEKWFQVISWSVEKYGTIKMDIRGITEAPHEDRIFIMKYFDKNGAEITSSNIMGVGYSTPKGTVEHVEAYGVLEDKMSTVENIIVYHYNKDGTLSGPSLPEKKRVTVRNNNPPRETLATINQQANNAQNCNYNPLPPLNARTPFSEALIKSALYERYSFLANTGGLSSPLAIGLTFLQIKILNSFVNTVTIIPGRGATRKNDAAPVNATVYRFQAKYIVCKKYNNATVQTLYESDNYCFKANNGNWASGIDGPLKTTELQ